MTVAGDILIVDDDPDMTEVIELVLQEAGYHTRTAVNGRDALAKVAVSMPSLILLDMLMPVMSGGQFAREFRARHGGTVPIVIATAAEHVYSRGEEIDATDLLPKPFDVADLLRVVSHYVTSSRPAHTPETPTH